MISYLNSAVFQKKHTLRLKATVKDEFGSVVNAMRLFGYMILFNNVL